MSGTKLNNGDLSAKGISIITKVETSNSQYNSELLEGVWWMWDADFDLQVGNKSATIKLRNGEAGQSMKDLLKIVIGKVTEPG